LNESLNEEPVVKVYPNPHTFSEGKSLTRRVSVAKGDDVKIYTISGNSVLL